MFTSFKHLVLKLPLPLQVICLCVFTLWGHFSYAETTRIEAENYIAAYDTNAGNSNGAAIACTYKGFNVDIFSTTDTNSNCVVGGVYSGEWIDYTINPQRTAIYRLVFRYATAFDSSNRTVVFKKGATTLASLSMPATGGSWSDFTDYVAYIPLTAGSQTLRMEFGSGWFDVNWFELSLDVVTVGSGVTYVEAENYNAAYDTTAGNGSPASSCTYKGLSVDVSGTAARSGCKVGNFANTEWVEHAINITTDGHYRFALNYSSNYSSTPSAAISINGVTEWSPSLPLTGSWETFQNVYYNRWFTAGFYIIKVQVTAGIIDYNYLSIERETVDIVDNSNYRIEAEDYIAAYDTAADNLLAAVGDQCAYYGMGVDVGDFKGSIGCALGYIANGEWIEFSVNVAQAGDYTINYNYANNTGGPSNGGQIAFKSNGTTKATTTITPITGGWDVFQNISDTVNLSAGSQTIRLQFTNPYVNLNWFSLQRAVPHHVVVSVNSSASTCTPASVSLTVYYANNEVVTNYTGTLTITTSSGHGNWAKTGVAADAYGTLTAGANDSGAAQYTFTALDNGSVNLALSNSRTESLTVSAVGSMFGESGTSGSVAYSTNAFIATDLTGGARVVGYPQQWRISMMAKDPVTGNCSVNTNYSKTGVKAWATRGSADPGGTAASLVDKITSASVSLPSTEPGSNNFNLTFVSGVAEFTLNTTDVLQHTLYIADKTRSFANVDLTTNTGQKTFAPFGFSVTATSNPGATTAAGAVYKAAGQNFTVNVTAVAWSASDDLDNNKIPDGHNTAGAGSRANLANNAAIARFGKESPAESITLSANLLLPAGGNNAGLSDGDLTANDARIITSFTGGAGSSTQVYYNEVGIIELKAKITDGQYMGASIGESAYNESYSGNVGRFTPANFTFNSGSLTESCQLATDFSYMGQTFTGLFTVTPKSSLGTSLQNYTGSFAKLALGNFNFATRDTNTATTLTSRLTGTATSLGWSGSTGTVNANLTLARAASPDGPYTTLGIGVDFTDSDGIALATASKNFDADGNASNDSASLGLTTVRFGRMIIEDAHGPETAVLNVPMRVEYWQSSNWLVNTDDSCTAIARSSIFYPGGNISTVGNRTVTVGSGSTLGSYNTIVSNAVTFTAGDGGHFFSAPGASKTGSFKTYIDLTNYPWLRFDWNADNNYSDIRTPDNQITFGSYRGHDRIMFWQEL